MAVTLTASNSVQIQVRARQLWDLENTQHTNQYANPVETATRLLMDHTARVHPVFDDAGRCVSVKVWYNDMADADANAVYSSTTADSSLACDIATGSPIGTKSTTYTPNLYIKDEFYVDDALCANDAQFADLTAAQLQFSMLKLRKALNTRCIQHLNTNAGANIATTLYTTDFTINGTATEVPEASFNNEDIWTKFQIIAAKNKILDYRVFDGTNLLHNGMMAKYLGLNADQKSFGAIFADWMGRYTGDLYDLDTVVGASATFLVNPAMIGFFNRTRYSPGMVDIDTSKGLKAFSVKDPVLKYRRNIVNATGQVVGTEMAPVEYDVVYQKTCATARDTNGDHNFRHKWEIHLRGGLFLGPVGVSPNHTTGILKFTKTAGI